MELCHTNLNIPSENLTRNYTPTETITCITLTSKPNNIQEHSINPKTIVPRVYPETL